MRKLLHLILVTFFLIQSCGNDKENNTVQTYQTTKVTEINPINIPELNPEIFKDTLEFISYDDNGDYTRLNSIKGKDFYSFINDKNDSRSLLRGDICQIQWKKDTIYIAGEGDAPEIANFLISMKKIKDGNVSKFRKEYKTKLKYHWSDDNYSTNYLDEIYLLVEYYIANTNNELVKQAIKDKVQIEYSIENRTENSKDYDVLGIGYLFEHRFTIMQWIYIDRETKQIYEYDLPNEKLIPFE